MGGLLLVAMLQASVPLRVIALRAQTVGAQQKLVLEATGDWGPVTVSREGRELVASLPAELTAGLEPPPVAPPLEGIRLVRERGSVQVRVTVGSNVPFEIRRTGPELALVFGTEPQGISPELLALYEALRPPAAAPEETFDTPPSGDSSDGDGARGIGIGPLRFSPSLVVSYSRSDASVDTPEPLRDSYFQVEPRLGTRLSLWDGRIRADYEPQLRLRSRFARINRPSHEANARADIPVGSRLVVRGSHHYALSTLDTEEVDPGREYFFRLGRFQRTDSGAGLQARVGPRLSVVLDAGVNRVGFHEETSFFAFETRRASAGFEFLLTEAAKARLAYRYDEVRPPSERPVVERTGRSVVLSLSGELLPLVTAELSAGYSDEKAPRAAEGGRRYAGSTLAANVVKELSRGTRLTLSGHRGTQASSFENNAFYVSNAVRAALDMQLPAGLSGRAGGGYHWNAYRTISSALGAPRGDRLYGWTAGVSRPLNRWSYLRVDYGWDRRESNVPAFNNESTTLLIQLGIGMFESPTP